MERAEAQAQIEEEIEEAVISYLKQETPEAEEKLAQWFHDQPLLTAEIMGNHCPILNDNAPDEF